MWSAAVLAVGLLLSAVTAGAPAAPASFEDGLAAYDRAVESGDPAHPGYQEAFTIWLPLVEAGHPGATYHVGMLRYFGAGGVPIDQAEGIRLIRSAADEGYPTAEAFLGLLAEQGDGTVVRRSEKDALAWYRKAAAQLQCAAVRRIARAYRLGELGLEADPEQTEIWTGHLAGCRRR